LIFSTPVATFQNHLLEAQNLLVIFIDLCYTFYKTIDGENYVKLFLYIIKHNTMVYEEWRLTPVILYFSLNGRVNSQLHSLAIFISGGETTGSCWIRCWMARSYLGIVEMRTILAPTGMQPQVLVYESHVVITAESDLPQTLYC
jgi:hypothetical protein